MNTKRTIATAFLTAFIITLGLGACKRQGPVERAGEEVDEAVDTLKNGGKESTANKLDDAGDDLRKGVNEAADEIKDK